MSSGLTAPFPYFGGKKTIADLVWKLLGNPRNYIEPFAGTAAVLLRRQDAGTVETLNDTSHWICNFWRAVKSDPMTVAKHADYPVSECDLHVRHLALMSPESGLDRGKVDPDYFDAKLAGWWVWGQCLWIGGGWCMECHQNNKRPNLGHRGGRGIFRHIGDSNDWGSETTEARTAFITDWIASLSNRLRNVRVCCGNWSRVCSSDTVLGELGTVGVFLDPPYATDLDRLAEWKTALASGGTVSVKKTRCGNRHKSLYLGDDTDVNRLVADVSLWCFAFGCDPNNRIVVCGLDGEHNDLELVGWKSVAWLPNGGFSNLSSVSPNARRERLWASPACLNENGEFPLVVESK